MQSFYYEHTVPQTPGYETGSYEVVHQTRLHWHSFHILEIVTEGRGTHLLAGNEQEICRGDVWLVSAGAMFAHKVQATGNETVRILNLSVLDFIPDRTLLQQLTVFGYAVCRLNEADTVFFCDVLRRISEERPGLAGTVPLVTAFVNTLFLLTLRKANRLPVMSDLIHEAIRFIRSTERQDLSLTELSNRLSVTPNYLGRLFHEKTGVSFTDYRTELRLRHACELLCGSCSVKEIAYAVGFSSVEYFCVMFRRRMGMTPTEWRNAVSASTGGE